MEGFTTAALCRPMQHGTHIVSRGNAERPTRTWEADICGHDGHACKDYCNAPHVNAAHYTLPSQAQHAASHGHKSAHAQLVYVINIQRHAKRTPDNLVPNGGEGMFNPPGGWDCVSLRMPGRSSGRVFSDAATVQSPARSRNSTSSTIFLAAQPCPRELVFPLGILFWQIYGTEAVQMDN